MMYSCPVSLYPRATSKYVSVSLGLLGCTLSDGVVANSEID